MNNDKYYVIYINKAHGSRYYDMGRGKSSTMEVTKAGIFNKAEADWLYVYEPYHETLFRKVIEPCEE